jgi:cytochrome oxidase Cu insertion factor (SCO1/SenC/PrrC family)
MAKKISTGRKKVALAFLIVFGPALFLVFMATRGCEHQFKKLGDYGAAANYKFVDVDGKPRSSADFKDDIVLVTTLQETCPDSCAVSFWHLNKSIYQHIYSNKRKKLKQVRIISFVTDGNGNPVKDLSNVEAMLKDRVQDYDPSLWVLASGNPSELYDFESNGEKLKQQGEEYFGNEGFQELILLLDKQNHLRMVLSGKTEGMIRRMKEHMALLQKQYDKKD